MDEHEDQDSAPSLSEKQELFLSLIAEDGLRDGDAAAAVGVSRWSPPRWRKTNPEFAERYKAARQVRIDHLVKEAERRAINGSDRLLEFLLCNYDPARFSNRQKIEHTGELTLADRLARGRARTRGTPDDGSDLAG